MAERAKGKGSGFPSMASSPTASSCSSSSSPFASSFYSLPVMALRGKIVEKVMENRVTLIVGETGCGKSSQVPQFLLEERIGPILCTQPRRFAVVAVAGMVAKARNCEVGDEVGYHIGRSKVLSARSKIIFKTAGVLLDEMREKGLNALNYKAIILDEVHERSVESDLVLVCVKQYLLKNNDLRLVLMSATADISRYRDYFKDLGRGERVEVLAIPSSNQQTIYQRRVLYLEQVIELIGISSESCSESLSEKYCSGSGPLISEADIKPEVHNLIHKLVLHIHEKEPDIRKSILVFLPTYYALEKQWHLLEPFRSLFKVHILHRSIDTKEALVAMKIWKSHRKVILATNIAESSVTIPEVAYVIDSCRSLQVFWDSNRKIEASELVWVSKSQAEQRRGRTGRTCDGQVYRLVTSSFYAKLQDYELPSILRLSLRQQVLLICCAESKAINDPKVLLQKALDPPDPEVVEDAFRLLIHFHALEKTHRGRYEPTFYGRLLASFSLSFDASLLILKLGNIGLLREGILLGILMDTLPLPIIRPFGQENLFTQYTACYFTGDNVSIKDCVLGKKELMLMANLCAFEFWQRAFMDKHRLEHLKQIFNSGELKVTNKLFPKVEEEWCSFHNLVQSSLHHVAEIYDAILSSLHRYRPGLLAHSDGLPSYYEPYEFQHTCLLKCQLDREADAIDTEDEHPELPIKIKKCITVPFVGSNHFRASDVAEKLATTIKEMRVHYAGDRTGSYHEYANGYGADASLACGGVPLCRYFLSGSCNRGGQCWFSHSLQAKRPACKFFFSMQGCRNGESCFFSHDPDPSVLSRCESIPCLPDGREADAAFLLQLLPTSPDSRILLLDDANLRFSGNFSSRYDPSKIISTTPISDASVYDSSVEGVRILWGLSDPQQAIMSNPGRNQIPWNEVRCVLWFPSFEGYGENSERQRTLVAAFFECLAIRILGDSLYEVRVIVTMNNIRFSRLEVERLGRDCFFFLTESFPFDESAFGDLRDTVATKRPGIVTKAISYVFDLCPPADLQFGDYTTAFYKHLHDVR